MKTKTFLILLITTLSVRAEHTAENVATENNAPIRLSLGEVTRIVLANNPAIREALSRLNAARARIKQEAAWDDVMVKADSRVARFVDVPPQSFTDQTVSIEQAVPITGKNLTRARTAAANAIAAFEQARRAQIDVLTKARASYFRLVNANAQLELNRRNLTSLRQIAEVSRSRYEVGKANAADALAAELEASKLLESEQDIARNISAEQSQLNTLMNRDAFAPVAVSDPAGIGSVNASVETLRRQMLANRPEIKIAQARIDIGASRLDLARRNWIPDPALMVQAERYNDSRQAASEVNAGVSFTVPWVNPMKYSAAVREAKATLAAEQQAFERTNAESLGALRDALQKVHTAKHHVELFRDKIVPQARQTFEANQFGYESGKATFLEWINAQRNFRDIEAMEQQHIADYRSALAELESVIGADLNIFPSVKTKEAK